jgi:Domain of unknown function (DUF6285)
MQDRPYVGEAIAAVVGHLRGEVLPTLTGQNAYSVRVAANLLAIVERELESGAELDRAELKRLHELLGEGRLEELNERLARGLRDGTVDVGSAAVVEHLRLTARDRLQVANPRYLEADAKLGLTDSTA